MLANLGYQIGLGLLRLAVKLPYRWQLALGEQIGRLAFHLTTRRRRIAQRNIELCFPELNRQQQRDLVRRHYRCVGISLFEIAQCWWGDDKTLAPLCHINGLQHLQQAIAEGKGVLLLSAHFTCLEIGGRLLALHHPFAVMYKRQRNTVLESAMRQSREAHFERAIEKSDSRGLLRTLKEGKACWYAPDQDPSYHKAVFADFFGIRTATVPAASRIAGLSGARVLPFFAIRREDKSGYDLSILPALDNFPSGDVEQDAQRINAIIEQQVRQAPEQYLWMHRRFKTRPAGEASLYDDI